MLRPTGSLALLLCIALASGCRTDIAFPLEETEPEDEEPACEAALEPRVEDCVRAAPDAVPLAELATAYMAAAGGYLYYNFGGRGFRLAMAGGEPEALTPPGSAKGGVRYVRNGFVYWADEGLVLRVPVTGGEPEPLIEVAPNAVWAVAGQAILHGGAYGDPSPLYRTSLSTGETTELLAEDPDQTIEDIGGDDDRALVALSRSLVVVPLEGDEPQVLVSGVGMSGAGPPIMRDGKVYFGAMVPSLGHYPALYRVDLDEPSSPQQVLPGFPVAFAFDDEGALYVHVIPQPETSTDEMAYGRIVRVPLSGQSAEPITDTSSWTTGPHGSVGPFGVPSRALVVSGCNVYFIEPCAGLPENEARLVTLSKLP